MNTSNNFAGQELLQYKQIKGNLHLPALVYSLLCTSLDKKSLNEKLSGEFLSIKMVIMTALCSVHVILLAFSDKTAFNSTSNAISDVCESQRKYRARKSLAVRKFFPLY